jgi:hypothetical protein
MEYADISRVINATDPSINANDPEPVVLAARAMMKFKGLPNLAGPGQAPGAKTELAGHGRGQPRSGRSLERRATAQALARHPYTAKTARAGEAAGAGRSGRAQPCRLPEPGDLRVTWLRLVLASRHGAPGEPDPGSATFAHKFGYNEAAR